MRRSAWGRSRTLLADDAVSEIMVNARDQIYIEKAGKPQLSPTLFSSEQQMMNIVERIVTPLGRRCDEKSPYVDARLMDGSRVHIIIPWPCEGRRSRSENFRRRKSEPKSSSPGVP